MQRVQRSTLLTALVAGCALAGAANAQVIRITNVNGSTGHDIPLKANSSVQIDSAGNLLAECALNASNVCTALSTGGTTNPNAPTATLTRVDTDADVRTGESIRLAWSSTTAEVCKATTAGPVSTGWNGVRIAADGGGELVNLSTVGTYTFSLVCYNAAGGSNTSSQSVVVTAADTGGGGGGGGVGVNCDITSNDPAFNPTNFTRVEKQWVQAFSAPDGSPQAVYPGGVSFPTPVGASKGTYVSIPFTPVANQSVNMYWDQVQSRFQDGYPNARPALGMFVAISPCSGDLRNWAGVNNPDHFLRPGCRKFEGSGSMVWTTAPTAQSDDSRCKLEVGQTYFLHFMPANPEGGLQTGEHSCGDVANSAQGCDVGVVFQSGPG